jgi:hypothetical protein
MRQRLPSHLTYANVMATIAVFMGIGGTTYAATGGNFILGKSNSASSKTSLSAPISDKALQLTNTNTGAGATALGLNVASGHAPFTVNSGTKVANLNADKLDGIDSTGFVPSSGLRRVGPVSVSLAPGGAQGVTLATIGNLTIFGTCVRDDQNGQDRVNILITSAVSHSTYASLTQAAAGGTFGNGDMTAGNYYALADIFVPTGTVNFNPISGSAVGPNGKEVIFNLYQGMNARNQPGQCIFGGTFAVK